MIAALLAVFLAQAATAESFRVATFNASLTRKGPGLLLRDIVERDPQIVAAARIIKTVRPDILLINELDHDYENLALKAFLEELRREDGDYAPIDYPHFFSPPQNVGAPSGQDFDGDGKLGEPEDAYGYGTFRGQYAMALLSRFPISGNVTDLRDLLWRDFDGARMPIRRNGLPFPDEATPAAMRLSSKSHWAVPISLPDGRSIHVLAAHPTPPVFDGPEDANGLRNADEIRLLAAMVDGRAPETAHLSGTPLVVMGDLNADPEDGDGVREAIRGLLTHPRLQDPEPRSDGAVQAAKGQGGANDRHAGDPALDTADWRDDRGPGNLRVDYVLPSIDWTVEGAGVFWPAPGDPQSDLLGSGRSATSDHRLVWVDLR